MDKTELAACRSPFEKAWSFAPLAAVLALATSYVVYVGYRQYQMLFALHFPDFDMSNYHQKVWLLSRFKEPFLTTRGLNAFGDHATFIDLIFVPFYWIVSTPLVLLWGETLALGLAGFMVYLIAEHRLRSAAMGLFLSACFFLYPAVQYLNFENYHPGPFAVLFFLMFWYGFEKKWEKLAFGSSLLLLSVKENMGGVLFGTGLYLWAFKKWKPGRDYMLLGLVYFLFVMLCFIPALNKNSLSKHGGRVDSPLPEFLLGKITMAEYERKSHSDENAKYFRDLTYPLGILPLASPLPVLTNPLLYFNLTTSWPYAHRIKYHYTAEIIGSIFVSLIEAIALIVRLCSKCRIKRQFVFAAVACLLGASSYRTNNISHPHFQYGNFTKPGPHADQQLLSEIDRLKVRFAGASLSVDYILLPFFADREVCYKFPNPLARSYYGTGDKIRVDTRPEYVVLTRGRAGSREGALLREHRYEEDCRTRKLVIFKATDAPDLGLDEEFYATPNLDFSQLVNEDIARSIAAGVSNRVIYVDGRYGAMPDSVQVLNRNGNTVHPYELGFMSNRDRLLSSGLLVMLYATHRTEPTDAEYQLLRQYIANGGRVLLLCPAWVWKSYDKKPLDRLPYARIAECFGLKMIFDSAKGTLSIVHPEYKVQGSEGLLEGTFSITDYRRDGTAFPIAEDSAGNAVCVAAIREDARIIVWGQNNLLSRKLEAKRAAADFLGKAIDWLFAGRPGDGRRDVSITQPPHTEQPK